MGLISDIGMLSRFTAGLRVFLDTRLDLATGARLIETQLGQRRVNFLARGSCAVGVRDIVASKGPSTHINCQYRQANLPIVVES